MTDAPTSAPVAKKAAPEGEVKEGKKRFEVKKVRHYSGWGATQDLH